MGNGPGATLPPCSPAAQVATAGIDHLPPPGAAAGHAPVVAGTGDPCGRRRIRAATRSPKTPRKRSAAVSGLNVARRSGAGRAHGAAAPLRRRGAPPPARRPRRVGRVDHDARPLRELRISATELSGRQDAEDGPAGAQIRQHLRGHRELDASGSRMATSTSALAMTRGQVLVGLEVEQHEVVGRCSRFQSSSQSRPLPSEIDDDPGVGVRHPQLRRRSAARMLGSCLRPSVPEYSTTGAPEARPLGSTRCRRRHTGSSSMGAQLGTTVVLSATPHAVEALEERRRDRDDRLAAPGDPALHPVGHPRQITPRAPACRRAGRAPIASE